MHEFTAQIPSRLLDIPAHVWVQAREQLSGTDFCIFLDGELYRDRVGAAEVIQQAQLEQQLPAFTSIYLAAGGGEARHRDYTCSRAFTEFLTRELPEWITQTLGTPGRLFLCGLSLSGLAALYASLQQPALFAGILAQSPSAWWESERLAADSARSSDLLPRTWISVGALELDEGVSHAPSGLWQGTSQLASCQRLVAALKPRCPDLHMPIYPGGHDPAFWGAELTGALRWLMQS